MLNGKRICTIILTSTLLLAGMSSADHPGQPYSSYWHPNDLLSWNPSMDTDAAFNRGNTTLADRFIGDVQVNSHARANEGKIAALSIMYPSTSGNPSQGSNVLDVYAFNYWQYIDILVLWGGSAGEGLILSPSADVIDSAHLNGVPVYGTIFLPPVAYGGQIQWVRDLVQTDGSTFPVADKLIEVANYYKFDGWFINQETAGGDPDLAIQLRNFMEYIQLNSDLSIMWYDSMTENGNISWQNALNTNNDMFFEDGATISDEMFLNFWWNANKLTNSANHALSLGRSPYDLYAGIDVQANGLNTNVNWDALFPEGEVHTTSLGFYCPNWSFSTSTTQSKFYQKANRFWIGPNRDPSNTTTTHSWKGLAHYVPAKSVINDIPWVTNFNTGQGHLYAIDGEVTATHDWNNRSLQDVLPTWRWIAECTGEALYPELDWSDAYYGGTCLKVSGDLVVGEHTHLKLYKTDLEISADTELVLTYKMGSTGTATDLAAGISFTDDPGQFEFYPVGTSPTAYWNVASFDLSSHAGKSIATISLYFESMNGHTDYEIKIGRIGVFNGQPEMVAPPENLIVDATYGITSEKCSARIHWDHTASKIRAYNIYQRHPDHSREFLGGTPNNAFFIPELNRQNTEDFITLEVEAVGPGFTFSTAITTQFDWPELPTPTPTVTPTPEPGNIVIELTMPQKTFGTGDDCWLNLIMTNPGPEQSVDLYVLLGVYDQYWCFPSWIAMVQGLDYENMSLATGANQTKEIIPVFQMPTVGPAGPFYFYGAMFEPGTIDGNTLIGNVAVFDFYLD